ncbi:MAG: outer membrane beta-barrel protein, partial [Bacteroidetes bacterium]|nr:outer membrane beta-barrel protein [Bacteroidota bacterium]
VGATGSADIKNHAILVGFEYEQRSDRGFNVSPYGLWERARQLTNSHINELDLSNPHLSYESTIPIITYDRMNSSPGEYNAAIEGENQSFFDYNLRKELGLNTDGVDYIDVFAHSPDRFKLDYFSANELLLDGYSLVSYHGYDHTGKRLNRNPTFEDFFNKRDDKGNLTREIGAFQPIYIAGYIQDKFSFDDLVFNVGLRVDRFDANQKVLRDPYSLFDTKKASELSPDFRPANIGDDYVVYVTDVSTENITEKGAIAGFRNQDRWFNAEGVEINDPEVLRTSSGNVAPWLVDPTKTTATTDLNASAFRDYTPQIIFMPRIAFSFPISDEALFFAHYDVLAKRPGAGLRFDPTDYLFLQSGPGGGVLNNPNLKPEKTITYELGFQQRLTQSSSLKLSAFYNEMRNMVQVINVNYAFPRSYLSYGNIDFGTVKGMTVAYDLRRTGNISMRATYTLQFADGTGSNAQTGLSMVNAGQPNLRTVFPLDFDQRHNFTTNLDFRFGAGKDYNGPVIQDKQIFARTGLNIIGMAGSGVPYSQQLGVTPDALAIGSRSLMKGSLNGSRLPWQFRLNFRLDRDIDLKWGKDDDKKKRAGLNVYIWVQNALNNKNIINVYRATGNPDDDGYLDAPEFANAILQQNDVDSYRELYMMKVNNPRNFAMPRTIRLGAILSF